MRPVLTNHVFNPREKAGNRWRAVADSSVERLYHSGAILIADGRVITTGSEMANVLLPFNLVYSIVTGSMIELIVFRTLKLRVAIPLTTVWKLGSHPTCLCLKLDP